VAQRRPPAADLETARTLGEAPGQEDDQGRDPLVREPPAEAWGQQVLQGEQLLLEHRAPERSGEGAGADSGVAPAQRTLVLDDPGLLPDAVAECLRLESSVQGLARCTTRDVTIRDTTIPEDSKGDDALRVRQPRRGRVRADR